MLEDEKICGRMIGGGIRGRVNDETTVDIRGCVRRYCLTVCYTRVCVVLIV